MRDDVLQAAIVERIAAKLRVAIFSALAGRDEVRVCQARTTRNGHCREH